MKFHPIGQLIYNKRNLQQIFCDSLNEGKRWSFFMNYIKWHLFYKFRNKSWTIYFSNGLKSIVQPYPDHDAGEVNIWTNNVDYYELTFIESLLDGDDVIFDLGCNVGNRTLALAHKLKGAILVDAGLAAYQRTKDHLELNRLDPQRFQAYNIAIGDTNRQVTFTNYGGADTRNQVSDDIEAENSYSIEMITIDELVQRTEVHPSIIKIDIEGQDIPALYGARKTLTKGNVKLVMFEHVRNEPLQPIVDYFAEIGWKMFAMDKSGKLIKDVNKQTGFNLFSVPESRYHSIF